MPRFARTPAKTSRAKSLRQSRSNAEALAWSLMRGGCTGFHFRRQHPIGPYFADFYCAKLQLVIEMDGDQHALQADYDACRTNFLEGQGLKVVRFWNRGLFEDIEGFERTLLHLVKVRAQELGVEPKAREPVKPLW